MMSSTGLLVLGLLAATQAVGGLKLTDLQGPRWPNRGDNAELQCQFDTENAKLYSVKWYKDEFEFYRYMPDSQPSSLVFPVAGVSIDESKSNIDRVMLTDLTFASSGNYRCEVSTEAPNFETIFHNHNMTLESKSNIDRVMLTDLTFASSGSYRCEVSTEAPNFETIFHNHNMTVLAYPRHAPVMDGMLETYAVHDAVAVNCTAAPSNPAPAVHWYINNLKADDYLVDTPDNPVRYPDNTFTTWATLKFILQRQHFLGPGKVLSLRCDAEAPPLPTETTTGEARLAGALNEMLAQQKRESGAGAVRAQFCLLLFSTILLLT